VNRRVVIALAAVVALIGGGILWSRGTNPVSAAPTASAPMVSTTPAVAPTTAGEPGAIAATPENSSTELPPAKPGKVIDESGNSAAIPASPQVDGVTDIDPHKAFGSKSAPVVMEVFSDYQCPACRALYTNTNRQLMDNYVSTGKVYLIHRDFPLQMHAYSRVAARYARAAAEIGKIEPAEKALFDNQDKWEQTGDVDGTLAAVLSSADMTKVRALVKGGTLEPLIDKDFQLGQGYRVNQTPTTVFHSKGQTYPYSGGMSYDNLHQFLDQLLSQK
jgi:protein-disulfide isomerase